MYEKNGVEYSTRTECIDWRYSAAILGLVKFYEYAQIKGFDLKFDYDEDYIYYNIEDITEELFLGFAENSFKKDMHHVFVENAIRDKNGFTEDEIKYTNMYCDETEIVVGRETSRLKGAGTHHVDGIQAVAYTRIRYTSGMDFERTHRQRIVLEKIVEKAQSANVITLNKLINEIVPQISTNLTTGNFLALASKATNYKLSEMSGFPFEVTTCDNVKGHKGSYVAPVGLAKNVTELHQFLFGKEDYDPSDEVKEANDAIIELTGVDPETYKETTDFTYKSGGEESDTSEKQNSK